MSIDRIEQIVEEAIKRILDNTISGRKITKISKKHEAKIHFMPIRYRILSGLLQSLNIQFGNFIEVLMHRIVEGEENLEIIESISGRKNVSLQITDETDNLIDQFITNCQNGNYPDISKGFKSLLKNIIKSQRTGENLVGHKGDVDILFRNKQSGTYYYIEAKYNDDHDTGKFVNINRKFLKTYAGLVRSLDIENIDQLKPILYYFNRKILKGNIYVPEEEYIYRGKKLFEEFFSIEYDKVDKLLENISENKKMVKIFDDLYKTIRYKTNL